MIPAKRTSWPGSSLACCGARSCWELSQDARLLPKISPLRWTAEQGLRWCGQAVGVRHLFEKVHSWELSAVSGVFIAFFTLILHEADSVQMENAREGFRPSSRDPGVAGSSRDQ